MKRRQWRKNCFEGHHEVIPFLSCSFTCVASLVWPLYLSLMMNWSYWFGIHDEQQTLSINWRKRRWWCLFFTHHWHAWLTHRWWHNDDAEQGLVLMSLLLLSSQSVIVISRKCLISLVVAMLVKLTSSTKIVTKKIVTLRGSLWHHELFSCVFFFISFLGH